ncbi:hypothetical protein SAMN05421688_2498 [Poseidonocella pacifica]|uniref:Aminoglycoside phosphotransferase domain-containing protein n=1 Tax=Poseidonocella pacifica TaxID=871651 RepID=A0A1I0XU79_9RHOB|nr:phosphotransferase [Poseidonocella pacifica]SFB04551.1 hypothetical protein SAMN05421688_2498 [Poseidonocella pacifica]
MHSELRDFLARAGWENAEPEAMQGDASTKEFMRLSDGLRRAVFMKDTPDVTGRFVNVAALLNGLGVSAPAIFSQDIEQGYLLMQDLGDDVFAARLAHDPSQERDLYTLATDVLLRLGEGPAPDLPLYTPQVMAAQAVEVLPHFAPDVDAAALRSELVAAAGALPDCDPVLMLRDYHAENLILLPRKQGVERAGLIDFQDAMCAHPAYDLVSLLQDARRDVSPQIVAECTSRFAACSGIPVAELDTAMALFGTGRALRILGIFARLAAQQGKTRYLDFVPRVRAHLAANLAHPALKGVRDLLESIVRP